MGRGGGVFGFDLGRRNMASLQVRGKKTTYHPYHLPTPTTPTLPPPATTRHHTHYPTYPIPPAACLPGGREAGGGGRHMHWKTGNTPRQQSDQNRRWEEQWRRRRALCHTTFPPSPHLPFFIFLPSSHHPPLPLTLFLLLFLFAFTLRAFLYITSCSFVFYLQ